MKNNRFSKVQTKVQQLKSQMKSRYHRLREDERALKAFQKGYGLGVLYLSVLTPVYAIDRLDELLEKALQNITDATLDELIEKALQNITNTTPAEAVGKLGALKNWLQKLNLPAARECFTAFGLAKLAGCSPYYVMGFISALLTYKVYKYWKPK